MLTKEASELELGGNFMQKAKVIILQVSENKQSYSVFAFIKVCVINPILKTLDQNDHKKAYFLMIFCE